MGLLDWWNILEWRGFFHKVFVFVFFILWLEEGTSDVWPQQPSHAVSGPWKWIGFDNWDIFKNAILFILSCLWARLDEHFGFLDADKEHHFPFFFLLPWHLTLVTNPWWWEIGSGLSNDKEHKNLTSSTATVQTRFVTNLALSRPCFFFCVCLFGLIFFPCHCPQKIKDHMKWLVEPRPSTFNFN